MQEIFRSLARTFQSRFEQTALVFSTWAGSEQSVMAKQTKITIESDSLLILQGRNSNRGWCRLCGAETEMIALQSIGVISNLDQRAFEQWLSSAQLHRSQAADGSALICLNSLLARVQNKKTS